VTESTTVSAPLVLTTYDISIPVATSSANGYLSSTDWSTFNGKAAASHAMSTHSDEDTYNILTSGTLNVGSNLLSVGDVAGKVGIGTNSPDNPLEVLSSTSPQVRITHTDNIDYLTITVDADGDAEILASGGEITFGNENLATSGTLSAGVATFASNSTIGNLTLANGSITDSGGTINFGDEILSTTGALGCGTITSSGNLIIADGGNIGSVSDTDAIDITAAGDVVLSQDLTVTGRLILGSGSLTDTTGTINFGDENFFTSGHAGFGIPHVAWGRLYAAAPDAQSAVYCGMKGYTLSDHTANYGVIAEAEGGGGTTNIGCYAGAANATNNYPFKDSHGNYSNAAEWVNVSDPDKKTSIRDLRPGEDVLMYNMLDKMIVKGYRMIDEIPILGYSKDKMIGEGAFKKPAPIYGNAEEAPERFGLLANDPQLPNFIVGEDKKGIGTGGMSTLLLVSIKYQKELIMQLNKRIETLEAERKNKE